MVVGGGEVVVRDRKRKGLEDRGAGRGLPSRNTERKEKLVSIALLKRLCPDLRPILSLQFHWQAGGIKQRDKEPPVPWVRFKGIWGSFGSVRAWGYLVFATGSRNEVGHLAPLSSDFNNDLR